MQSDNLNSDSSQETVPQRPCRVTNPFSLGNPSNIKFKGE